MIRKRATGLAMVGLALLGAAGVGTAAVHAGERGGPFADGPHGHRHGRWSALSAEDRAAFADARIAGLHAGLKLNPEQEKLWPPVEAAMRDLFKQRAAQREAPRERGRMVDDAPGALRAMVLPALLAVIVPIATGLILGVEGVIGLLAGTTVCGFGMAVFMSNAATARGEALRKLADASTPLFATLDDGQKRRAMLLARPMRPFGGPHKGWHRHGPGGPGGRDGSDE